ncbi:hypothetical protein BGW36DRAFT_460960 [Talaromyces proteolyticus]|uniref:Zn(2)-C6 fungal-type domain-containing protein n=1 Tax=Talaromyces proteolyticus TaxID=1131652 RepID=A0AAD4KZ55_9EURO|nr:uncharacterized protein BGW36DRAFT_460960 [Talaromyces proteolyticus]KAH8699186.1 hypothetical protein BGW36DRAFT_460960 [Talaromyces proteolyticus]
MPSRRFHSKSRHGCIACKKRKVKCDIERPVCSNCARRKEECVYHLGDDPASPHASRVPPAQAETVASNVNSSGSSALRVRRQENVPHLSHEADLSFLERFVSEVSRTLSGSPESQQTWALEIGRRPSFQPSASYLSHIIIAVSTLHISLTQRSLTAQERTWYLEKGLHHQNAALVLMQPVLGSLKNERSHIEALFGAVWLVFLFSVSLPRPSERKDWIVDQIVELSELAKGVIVIITAICDISIEDEEERSTKVMTGPLRAFFAHFLPWKHRSVSPSARRRSLPPSLQQILATIESDEASSSSSPAISPAKRELYYHAIDELAQTITALTFNFRHPAIVFMWLIGTHRGFMELVAQRDELALRIFRIYGIWATRVDWVWFVRNWGRSVVEGAEMALNQK